LDEKKQDNEVDELDDLLEEQWNMQDQIQKKCQMKDNHEEKVKKWKEKYG
jgi:hypothetical protein